MKFILGLLVVIFLLSCSGEDVLNKDNIPPNEPHMVPHLGDTGDYLGGEAQNYYLNEEMEFNGIDAVPGANWIQIQWEHIADEDADLIEVYRFNMYKYNYYIENLDEFEDEEDFASLINTITSTENDFYVDSSDNLLGDSWFYYIKVFDEAGNSTKSDTVCYNLIDLPTILYPQSGVINLEELEFGWTLDSELSPSQSRLLLFNENRELLWVYTPLDFDGTNIEYPENDLEPQTLIWRIDVFAGDQFYTVMGKNYQAFSGAESLEYVLYLQ